MAMADVGDDVFGEDPTVNALQAKVAKILGKEASIFVPSGTMGNQLAIKSHTQPGDEVIIEATSHPYNFEGGASAALSGIQFYCLKGVRGILDATQFEEAIRPDDHHFPVTKLICLENTHNRGGGTIYPIQKIAEISRLARSKGLSVHLDGARLWNASVASGIKPQEYARWATPYRFAYQRDWELPSVLWWRGQRLTLIGSIAFERCLEVECVRRGSSLLPDLCRIIISNV
jgi:threonine aldolase